MHGKAMEQMSFAQRGECVFLPVHFLSVPYPHNEYEQHLILDLVNNAVVTEAEAVEFILSEEFFDALRARVIR